MKRLILGLLYCMLITGAVAAQDCFDFTQRIPCGSQAFPRQAGDFPTAVIADRFQVQPTAAMVYDRLSHLYWQQCTLGGHDQQLPCGQAQLQTWESALHACQSLALADRHWRLPTVLELNGLLQLELVGIKLPLAIFPQTKSGLYWTETRSLTGNVKHAANFQEDAWTVDFATGNIFSGKKQQLHFGRCVSDP